MTSNQAELEPKLVPERKRVVELDAIRALAAINLVAFHFTHVYAVKYGFTSSPGFEFPWGKYGVQLFFMLSGLVNAMTLMKKQNAREFLSARFVRICPAFWAVVIINCLVAGLAPLSAHGITLPQLLANLTIMPNLLGFECIEPVTWTLQIEILFYGVLVLLFLTGALQNPLRAVWSLLALSTVTCLCIRYLEFSGISSATMFGMEWYRDLLILEYIPLFTIGILLNEVRCGRGSWKMNAAGIVASMIAFHAIDRHDHNPAITLALFALLAAAAFGKAPFLRFGPLVWISSFSYALYLLHNNLGCVLIWHMDHAGIPPVVAIVLAALMVGGAAALVTWKIERPVTNWLRNRLGGMRKKGFGKIPVREIA
jgi:peptidoglycan/LPS O-acetylase OafA/YrhL